MDEQEMQRRLEQLEQLLLDQAGLIDALAAFCFGAARAIPPSSPLAEAIHHQCEQHYVLLLNGSRNPATVQAFEAYREVLYEQLQADPSAD